MPIHLLGKDTLLELVSVLKELLDDVVSKNISHQLERIRLDFSKYYFLLVAIGSFKLLLDKSRAMLVTTKLHNMVVDVLKFC